MAMSLPELEACALAHRALGLALAWETATPGGLMVAWSRQLQVVLQDVKKRSPPEPELAAALQRESERITAQMPKR